MSQALKGLVITPEMRAKISATLTGKKRGSYPPAWGAAISKAKKGKPATPKQLDALAKAAEVNRGKEPWNKGKTGYLKHTDEWKAANSQRHKGKKRSAAARRNMSNGAKGKVFSETHRQAMSEAAKKRWARGEVFAFRSKLEQRLEWLIKPLGFQPQFRIPGYRHHYDYGCAKTRLLIEVYGCYWHAHTCGVRLEQTTAAENDRHHEQMAHAMGYRVVILWQCEEAQWPVILRDSGVLQA